MRAMGFAWYVAVARSMSVCRVYCCILLHKFLSFFLSTKGCIVFLPCVLCVPFFDSISGKKILSAHSVVGVVVFNCVLQTNLALQAMTRNGTFSVIVTRSTPMAPGPTGQLKPVTGRQQERTGW